MPEWYICSPWGHQPHCDVSLFFFFFCKKTVSFSLIEIELIYSVLKSYIYMCMYVYIYIYSCCLFISNGFDIRSNTKMEWSLLVGARAFILIFAYIFICSKYLVVILLKHLLFLSRVFAEVRSPALPLYHCFIYKASDTHELQCLLRVGGGGGRKQRWNPLSEGNSICCVLICSCGWAQSVWCSKAILKIPTGTCYVNVLSRKPGIYYS